MRYLLILVLLGSLSGCLLFEDPMFYDDCAPTRTVEPPRIVTTTPIAEPPRAVPVQTGEPPR